MKILTFLGILWIMAGTSVSAATIFYDSGHSPERPAAVLKSIANEIGIDFRTFDDPITDELLAEADVLMVMAPQSAFSADERASIISFVEKGGSLFFAQDEERRQTLEKSQANLLLEPFGVMFTGDIRYIHNCGGLARAGAINPADREIPFSGGRAVAGGTAFSHMLGESGQPGVPFGTYLKYGDKGKVIVMGEIMVMLALGEKDAERLSGVPNDPRKTHYWGSDSRAFIKDVMHWLVD